MKFNKKSSRSWLIFIFVISRLLITFFGSIFISTATSLLMIVNITPGGVCTREIIIKAISIITGCVLELGVLVSTMMRACSFIIHVAFGIPSLIHLKMSKII